MANTITITNKVWTGTTITFNWSYVADVYAEQKLIEWSIGGVVKGSGLGDAFIGSGSGGFAYSSTTSSVQVDFKLYRWFNGAKGIQISSNIGAIFTKAATIPSAPVIENIVSSLSNNRLIKWNIDSTATQYNLEVSSPSFPNFSSISGDFTANTVSSTQYGVNYSLGGDGIYQWRIRAKNSSGYSAYSNVTSYTKTTATVPPAPTLSLGTVANTAVTVSWVTNGDGSSPLTGFRLYRYIGTTLSSYFDISSGSRSYTDTGLVAGTTYKYIVSAINSVGFSANSNTITATTSSPTTNTVPSTPVLSVTPIDKYNFILSWTGNVTDQFNLERATSTLGYSSLFGDLQDADNQVNTNIPAVTETYYYRIRTKNNVGYSLYSNVITVVNTEPTPEPPPPPPTITVPNAPILQMLVSSDPLAKLLKWNMDSNVISYNIESSNPLTDPLWMSLTGNLVVGTDLGTNNDLGDQHWGIRVTMGTQDGLWKYRIRAQNSLGYSNYSNVVSYTISNNIPEPPPPTTDNKNLLSILTRVFAMGTGLGLLIKK